MPTRKELQAAARATGRKYFHDDRPCRRGHHEFRTSNLACIICEKLRKPVTGSFAAWVREKGYTAEQTEAALAAWVAAGGPSPNLEFEIMRLAKQGRWPGVTPQGVADTLNISVWHASRLIRRLRDRGQLHKEGRSAIWKVTT